MNDLDRVKECLTTCKKAVKEFSSSRPDPAVCIKTGLQAACVSMEQSRKRLSELKKQYEKSLERRKKDGKY